jgi:hypothetical protein
MPNFDRPDTQRSYRVLGKLREIALGTNEHSADDPDLLLAAEIGHVEHDGEAWLLTGQGRALPHIGEVPA